MSFIVQLFSNQQDCFYEVIKYLNYDDRYYLLYFLSSASSKSKQDEEHTFEILNQFGMELMKRRIEIYRKALKLIESISITTNSKGDSKSTWIVDPSQYKKLLQFYKNLSSIFDSSHSVEKQKNGMVYQLELLGFRLNSIKTIFHIFREMINFEKELLERSLPKYQEHSRPSFALPYQSISASSPPLQLRIGILGLPKSGKESLLCSYCANMFPDNVPHEKQSLFEAFVMIESCVVNCKFKTMDLNNEKIVQEEIEQTFDVVAFTCHTTVLNNIAKDDQLFEKLILQNLRKIVMTFPLIPIHFIITGKDLDLDPHALHSTFEKLENFPHLINIGTCSSLTQEGLKSVFDEMFRSAISYKFQTLNTKKNCSLQ